MYGVDAKKQYIQLFNDGIAHKTAAAFCPRGACIRLGSARETTSAINVGPLTVV
jgi:hypothetical protein